MQQVDWSSFFQALTFLIVAVTFAINLRNQRHISEMKSTIHEINGNIQKQLNKKTDKLTPG